MQPQLFADNFKCVSRDPGVLLRAARFTTGYVRLVGQQAAPSKCVLMSTSRSVRGDTRGWIVTDGGDKRSVKLDVRDLGGHLDTTFQGWSATLATRVRLVIHRLVLICVLPLVFFHGRIRVVRSMFIPGALHGIEASFLADTRLRKLRTAMGLYGPADSLLSKLVQYLVCLMARRVAILLFALSGSGFVCFVGTWRIDLGMFTGCIGLIDSAAEGCPGRGPAHLLVESAGEVGFQWDSHQPGWERPGSPVPNNLAGLLRHFRAAVLEAWRSRVSADLCARKGFRGGPVLDIDGTLQLLDSGQVRERDKALLRGVLAGGVWHGFRLRKVRGPACAVSVLWRC